MNFSREQTWVEYFFLVSFVLIYLYYFYRVIVTARRLHTTATGSIFKFVIRSIYLGAISLALLGPNFGITETEARAAGKDIFFVFDLSESMNANDVEPSRLDRAKGELIRILNQLNKDRLGLIVFNSDAYVNVPLTFDEQVVLNSVRTLKTSMIPRGSTDYNPMLELLNDKLASGLKSRAKVAVIITDGEVHYEVSKKLISELRKNQIHLFFVAVGSIYGSKIPEMPGYKKDKEGNEMVSTLGINTISSLAKLAEGEYFVLDNQRNEMSKLVDKVTLVVSAGEDKSRQNVTYNKYILFVLIALLFASIDFLIVIKVIRV